MSEGADSFRAEGENAERMNVSAFSRRERQKMMRHKEKPRSNERGLA